MVFGLANASAMFQQAMYQVYMDDIAPLGDRQTLGCGSDEMLFIHVFNPDW